MSIFDSIRRQVSKRRRRKRDADVQRFCAWLNNYLLANNLRIVPYSDFVIMREARKAMADGKPFIIDHQAATENDKNCFGADNAKILHQFYGMNEIETLIETGHWVK